MKILLICPLFYDYHQQIIDALQKRGHKVVFFPERPPRLLYSVAKRLGRWTRNIVYGAYKTRILREASKATFDLALMIRCEIFTQADILNFRSRMPDTAFIMHQWDSDAVSGYGALIPYFDYVTTFDLVDAALFKIDYVPLFFSNDYLAPAGQKKDLDLCFVASYQEHRYNKSREVISEVEKRGGKYRSHLYIQFIDYLKLWLSGRQPGWGHVTFQKLSRKDVAALFRRSRFVLDIENKKQTGLTIRTFEALASRSGLISTNPSVDVLANDFPGQVYWLDENRPFQMPHDVEVDAERFEKNILRYSLDSWISQVLGEYERR